MKELPANIRSTAVYGNEGCYVTQEFGQPSIYRYRLTRIWDDLLPRLCFIMLNPSTATEFFNDPTVAKCMKWAKEWLYGSVDVVNLFAYRATKPKAMKAVPDPIGLRNDAHIIMAAQASLMTICAWGSDGAYLDRGAQVQRLLWNHDLWALKISDKTGQPWHPLYLPNATTARLWRPRIEIP